MATEAHSLVKVPRIAIEFCTQCKWNLRAAYYAQELLQTFGTSIGEIALIPVTGGIFSVTMTYAVTSSADAAEPASSPAPLADKDVHVTTTTLWDRKIDGGFPETKELKNRVRNIIEPGRDLGHIDRSLKKGQGQPPATEDSSKVEPKPEAQNNAEQKDAKDCEDCK